MHMHEGFQGLPGLGMRCRIQGLWSSGVVFIGSGVYWLDRFGSEGLGAWRTNNRSLDGRSYLSNDTNGLCRLGLVW